MKITNDEERALRLRDAFPLNCRVKQSQHSIEIDRFPRERKGGKTVEGSVVGYCREPDCIRVLVDGKKHPCTWHMLFWERIP